MLFDQFDSTRFHFFNYDFINLIDHGLSMFFARVFLITIITCIFTHLVGGSACMFLCGCGLGPNISRLLSHHWGRQYTVPMMWQFLGKAFDTVHYATQGNPALTMIFNIVVD